MGGAGDPYHETLKPKRNMTHFTAKRIITVILVALGVSLQPAAAQDYSKARRNVQEAEMYMKKAEANRKTAYDLQKKAEQYQSEASRYTKLGKDVEAKQCNRKAEQALEDKKAQLGQAKHNDTMAAQCFRAAATSVSK